jgi:hypothetical protein
MDDKLQSEPNVRTINKFLEAVGLPIKVQYIKKRRNRQQYEVIVISESVAQFSCGGSFDLRVDDAKITTFVNKLLELIVETLNHLNRLFSYKCRELFVIPVHGFGVGACRLRFRNNCCTMKNIDGILLQNSLIRYFNEFVHISSRDKIKLEKLLSYNSALSVLGEPYIRNYGFYFVIKRGLFSSTFSEVLNTPAHPLFAASCYSGHIFNLPDCSDPVLHSNLISHYNNMVDQEFRSHNDVVNNWFSSSISSVPELRTGV